MADIRAQISRVRDAANDITDSASEKLKDTRDSAGNLIQSGRERATEAYDGARDRTQKAATRANEIIQDHPIVAVAGAVAAGAVIAWMFPKSRAVLKALPGLATTAGARFVEAAIAARTAAAEGADVLKSNAGHAYEVAREKAGDAAASARDAAATARDAATSTDLPARASRLADEILSLVVGKAEAASEAFKARLPKK